MASIVSKLARAAFATSASPSACPRGGLIAELIRASPAGGLRPGLAAARPRKPPLLVDENVLKSNKAVWMWDFYYYWCNYHGLKRDRSEMGRRFRTFSAKARFVHKANNYGEGVSYAMTKYADTSDKELFRGLARRTKN